MMTGGGQIRIEKKGEMTRIGRKERRKLGTVPEALGRILRKTSIRGSSGKFTPTKRWRKSENKSS